MRKSELTDAVKEGVQEAVLGGVPDDDPEVFVPSDVEDDEISAADALIDEIRGEEETTVNVYRIGAGRGKETFLYAASPEDITAKDIMERCRDQHGGGDFKMVTRDANRIVKSARFSVEKAIAGEVVEKKSEGIGTTELLAIMQQNNTQVMAMFQSTMTAFAEAFKGNQTPAFDPNAATKTIMESVAAMKSLTDAPKDTSGQDMVKMLVQGVELASKLTSKDGETNSYDFLAKMVDSLPALAEAAKNIPTMGAPGAPGGGPHMDPKTEESVKREHQQAQEKAMWKMNVGMLVAWAQQGRDPELYAELILDQMGRERVLEFISHPDALERLASYNNDVFTYRGWFLALKEEIESILSEEQNLTPGDGASDTPIEGELATAGEADGVQSDGADAGNAGGAPGGDGGST